MVVRSSTGYGVQCGLFAPRIAERYDLAVSSFYGLDGGRLVWQGVPIFPGLGGTFGNEYLAEHAKDHFDGDLRGGLVLTLLDVWVLNPALIARMDTACWVPVDHEPAPPAVLEFFQRSNAIPIAMSRFGEQQLKDAGLEPLYCPHGVDTDTYRPMDRREMRKKVGLSPDVFVVGMVAANKGRPSRKGFQQALEAFRLFRAKHDDAKLYLHTSVSPDWAQGEDLMALIEALGLPGDSVLLADQYRVNFNPFSPDAMAKIVNSFDVLLNPAHGEGFGIPVLEAASCGVPAVVTNFSAMPEVAGDAGWHVGCRPFWTPQRSFQFVPDVEEIVEALNRAYGMSKAEKAHRAKLARQHALTYDVDVVFDEFMVPALEAARERVVDRRPVEAVAA
jgi:glycosyltransferase involved in cell wall biosynthesis